MKIGQPADASLAPLATGTAGDTAKATRPAGAAPAATAAAPDASAKVALSSTAETMRAGSSSAEFDADKVARMSEAIANGTFKVDAGAIADKLIANAQEVLGKVSGR